MNNKGRLGNKSQSTLIVTLVLLLLAGWNFYDNKKNIKNFKLDRAAQISYSKHAKCRMDCRHIDKTEVKEILENGSINTRKSKPKKGTLALEGRTHDDQMVRVVFAKKSSSKYHVVTVIDLNQEWDCDCY